MVIAALFALLTLLTLGWAVWREEHPAWERYEREHRERAAAAVAGLPEARRAAVLAGLPRGPLQDYVPGAGVVDRCRSCHRGLEDPALADAPPPHTAHPGRLLRDHPPSEFGCTVCHGGQGPNLSGVEAAHGRVPYWDQPLLPQRYLEASCGRCHRAAELPTRAVLERGRGVAERECAACHDEGAADAGDGAAPSLRHVGIGRSRRWLADYLRDPDSSHARHWSAGRVARAELTALVDELANRKGAEKLLQGRLLYNERGCGGCHQIDGVGGVLGIELSEEGLRVPRQLDFRRMPAAGDVVGWQEAHLLKPGGVVAGSNMIDPKLRSEQVELLVTYVLSLYPNQDYDAWRPPDHGGFREETYLADAVRGESLYGRYCAACHASNGRGGIDVVHGGYAPALFNKTFLALADSEFLAFNIAQGREQRNMPAWRNTAGLGEADVMSIVRYLRSLPRAELPRFEPPFLGSAERGRASYGVQCAGCHGERGEGGVGPALALPGVQKASDELLYATIALGRPGTAMLPYDLPGDTGLPRQAIADLVAYLRTLPEAYDAQP